jgi:hypothetical protein
MIRGNYISKVAAFFVLGSAVWAADSVLVVDRGLPQANLNNVSGTARSNVRWASDGESFLGDDFSIGAAGERWVIDSIRTWAVPGLKSDPEHLGDFYQDVRLYFGMSNGSLTPRVTATLQAGSDETGSSNVLISEATKSGAVPYDDFGAAMRIWQIDFTNLNLVVNGGVKYGFGVWGLGRAIPGNGDKGFEWFNHASNAELSGVKQDGADGLMLTFDGSGKAQGSFSAQGNGWDKNSDINVQVFAHRVAGPSGTLAAAQ